MIVLRGRRMGSQPACSPARRASIPTNKLQLHNYLIFRPAHATRSQRPVLPTAGTSLVHSFNKALPRPVKAEVCRSGRYMTSVPSSPPGGGKCCRVWNNPQIEMFRETLQLWLSTIGVIASHGMHPSSRKRRRKPRRPYLILTDRCQRRLRSCPSVAHPMQMVLLLRRILHQKQETRLRWQLCAKCHNSMVSDYTLVIRIQPIKRLNHPGGGASTPHLWVMPISS